MSKTLRLLPALAGVALALSACNPKSASELGHKLTIHGVVTDTALLTVLSGVKVTLLSADNDKSVLTDARGYFQFTNVLQIQNLLIQFQLDGYQVVTMQVNASRVASGPADAGTPSFPGFGNDVDGFDASIALTQQVLIPVAGTVYDGTQPAKGARVLLNTPDGVTTDGVVTYQTKAGDDGRFTFAAVRPAVYSLIVLPYDRDADGFSDTQFYLKTLNIEGYTATNVGNIVIVLQDVSRTLVASSFTSLSNAYPIALSDLTTEGGITGVLQFAGSSLFLHFGAEVDPLLTAFELVAVEPGPRYSPPIGLTVTWDHGSVAHLATATPLVQSDDVTIGYELRIRALRWRDGSVGITASPTSWGTITFDVQALPGALANPTPAIYFANKFTATQATTQAVVDANTIWLLDANGDFVFDTAPAGNFSVSMQLSWQHVTGAVKYHVMARNTTSGGNGTTANLDWRELAVVGAPDPNQNPTVVASVFPFGTGLGGTIGPWGFGNTVQFAVVSEDALGFKSPIDTSKLLSTADTFPGLLTGAEIDNATLTGIFAPTTEAGVTFNKAVRVSFSEPMNTTAVPTLTSLSANLTVKKTVATAWGTTATSPSSLPLNVSPHAFFELQLSVKGACTEVLAPRVAGDTLVPVRDASLFAAGATSKVAFIDNGAGGFLAEAQSLANVDPATNRLTLGAPLVLGVFVPAGSLACALSGAVSEATLVPPASATSTTLGVSDATPFFAGESVLIYEPQGATTSTPPISEVRIVTGVDTVAKSITVPSALSAGHTAASLVVPLNGLGGEVALRVSYLTFLVKDSAGGTNVEIFVSSPSGKVLVGDTVLVDADGDLKTTTDQVQAKVLQVKNIPSVPGGNYSIIVDSIPASLTIVHGKSKVITLGDSFAVGGTRDTSSSAVKPLDPHRDQFAPDGFLY